MLERKLFLSQTYLDTLINSVPDLIWFKRLDGIHVKVNDYFCATVQKEREDVEGHDHYHIWGISKEVYENSDYVCLDTDSIVTRSQKNRSF
jgi:PAS domain-containing protein